MADRVSRRCVVGISACVLLLAALGARQAGGVTCPGTGAKILVVVNNPTGSTVDELTVTVSGEQISGEITCTNEESTYSHDFTELDAGDNPVYLPTEGGLNTGMWKHQISVSTTGQTQHTQGVTLYASAEEDYSEVRWTYFPQVVTVNVTGDAGTSTCPPNCDLRQAFGRATNTLTSSATNPTLIQLSASPGAMASSSTLVLGDGNSSHITVDGTDSNGNPWIVGDALAAAQGSQDSFSRVIDLNDLTFINVGGEHVTMKGLAIDNTTEDSTGPALVQASADNLRLDSVRLDGGAASLEGADPLCDQGFLVTNNEAAAVAMVNVEGRSAHATGIYFTVEGGHTIEDSWIHHNHCANVTTNDAWLARNTIELAGFRAGDDEFVGNSGESFGVTNVGFVTIATEQNLIRNNVDGGIYMQTEWVDLGHDYVCGNENSGVTIDKIGTQVAIGTGVTTAYNYPYGLYVDSAVDDATLIFNTRNAFTANAVCGLLNDSSETVSAQSNQWRGVVPPSDCTSSDDYCSGSIVCSTVLDYPDDPVVLDNSAPIVPSNAILKGQTVRILGQGFDAITGNPEAGENVCEGGLDVSEDGCCRNPGKANFCSEEGSPPEPADANCVSLKGYNDLWYDLPVTAVTPTTITAEIASTVFYCQGEQGEEVRVARIDSMDEELEDFAAYCNNSHPK